MNNQKIHAIAGTFEYSGKYIAKKLLYKGCTVITLTNSLYRENPFAEKIKAFPFNFDKPEILTATLKDMLTI